MKDISIIYRIDPNIRTLVVPSVFIVVILGLIILSINTGYSKVTDQITSLDTLESQELKLSKKLDILRSVEDGLLEYTNASLIAVPDKDPTTWSLSLIRSSIIEKSLSLKKAGAAVSRGSKDLSRVVISLEVGGNLQDILAFADDTRHMAPIVINESIRISGEEGSYKANVALSTFWSTLPKKIPAIEEPITNLNEKEIAVLVDIKDLMRPEFNVLVPQENTERESPFK